MTRATVVRTACGASWRSCLPRRRPAPRIAVRSGGGSCKTCSGPGTVQILQTRAPACPRSDDRGQIPGSPANR
ncbi:conserved hypothetical protein [Ricinus communis]|uniref:Uncharacterized protein n=1 Tax=Ricinus communis TaxID=3988 RepID=B9TMN5_RICCO|nr:conserved hypothetical protein [Ricinus communis]